MNAKLKFILYILCFSTFLETQTLSAQAFESLEIGGFYANVNIQQTVYSDRWETTNPIGLNIRMPFYIGTVGVNLSFFEYRKKVDQASDAIARNTIFFWGINLIEYKKFSFVSGVSTGMLSTKLTESQFNYAGTERELNLGLHSEFRIKFEPIILFTEVQYQKVYNYYRQELIHLNFGLKMNIDIPKKVVDLVK